MTPASMVRARQLIVPALAAAADALSPALRHIVAYHWGWVDEEGKPAPGAAGKALRPTLAMLSAEAVGAPAERARACAAAVELVHDFTLLHDDVMDGDRERRHRPTAWTVFGVGHAICAGDALLLSAQRVLLEDPAAARSAALAALCDATQDVIAGQILDLSFEGRLDVALDAYLDMAARKTGALLGCSASIGAILAGGPDESVRALRAFGGALGLAFQAVDDWLGIWGRPERTGKPVANDLRQRKSSLPIVLALGADGAESRALRALLASPGPLDEDALAQAVALLDGCGAETRTREEAARQIEIAGSALARAPIEPAAREELLELARFVVEREL